jgi:hypothetical protein
MHPDKITVSDSKNKRDAAKLTNLESEGRQSVKSSYHEILAVVITLAILIFGYLWGMYTRPSNFARSGTLIIITGIIFAALDLSGRLAHVDEWVVARLRKIRPAITPASNKKDQERVTAQIDQREILEGSVTSGVREATDKARARLRIIEVFILIVGSLVHGFGDLIVIHMKM